MQKQTWSSFLQRNSQECSHSQTMLKMDDSSTRTDRRPYPLSVSWPRRRTRCTSLWSTALVKRLAWYGPSPVWPQATCTTDRDIAAHPSSTWASFPDPIGRPGDPSHRRATVKWLTLRLSGHRLKPEQRSLDLDPDQVQVWTPEGLQKKEDEVYKNT